MKWNKYTKLFQITLQNSIAYRVDFAMGILSGIIPLAVQILLWSNIYSVNQYDTIRGYSLPRILSYILVAIVISKIIQASVYPAIAQEIKSGTLSKYLAKPLDHQIYWLVSELGGKILFTIAAFILLVTVLFFTGLGISAITLLVGALVLVQALLISFFIYYLLALLSFWFLEVSQIFTAFGLISTFLSGGMIPIDFFPDFLQKLLVFLPFKYIIYFPITLFTTNLERNYVMTNLAFQFFWVILLFFAGRLMWFVGERRYSAFGG
ncbi:ABC transporter permease [Paenibacillus piscarius]|uniref:ABC transporter permease n=1 Tax=Paenibacillus piscarius TaxID=1089681 RepID=UPI001EE83E57|nr:ABC-2 family transporter protein [Paenibacillus piscarius]